MTFKKGHAYYPPRVKNKMVGASIRDYVNADALRDFHVARAAGKINVRLIINEDGSGVDRVTWDDTGIPPTSAEISESIAFLTNYHSGRPVETVKVEDQTRVHLVPIPVGTLPASAMHAMREIMLAATRKREALGVGDAGDGAADDADAGDAGDSSSNEAIDAEFTDVPDADETNDGP